MTALSPTDRPSVPYHVRHRCGRTVNTRSDFNPYGPIVDRTGITLSLTTVVVAEVATAVNVYNATSSDCLNTRSHHLCQFTK